MNINHKIFVNFYILFYFMNLIYSTKIFIYEIFINELFNLFISNIERLYIDLNLRKTRC